MSRPHSSFLSSLKTAVKDFLKTKGPSFKQVVLTVGMGLAVFALLFSELHQPVTLKELANINKIIGLFLLSAILATLLTLYISIFHKDIFVSGRLTALLYFVIGLTLIVAKLFTPSISGYLIPLLATVMLVSIIFSAQLAFVVGVFCSLFISALTGNPDYIIFGLLAASFTIFLSQNIKERSNMVSAGIYMSIASAVIAFVLGFVQGKSIIISASSSLWASAGAGFSVIIAIGLLAFIEPAFQITTDFRLLDLANPNQPLLRELMIKAPGTYNHSVLVGNLADAAAQKLNANQLLARVGAYYHDIGKIKRPLFFIENNFNQKDFHENLNPNLSCMIIRSHVDEGLALAKKYNLPNEIQSVIEQHHGTSVVSYFYELARQNTPESKEDVQEDNYRYPGRKPQSKEAAIVMLADAVEAAARTAHKPSINRYKQIAKKITDAKLKDGQLDESDLTLGDLQKIVDCFANMLYGIYHQRIEYPENNVKQGEKSVSKGRVIEFKKITGRPL